MKRKGIVVVGLIATWAVAACSGPTKQIGSTGLAIEVELDESVEATALRYTVKQVECAGQSRIADPLLVVRDRDIELPLLQPGAGGPQGQHPMGDQFVVVPAGCYDVTIEILDGPSVDCGPAMARGVMVEDGKTTEILLALQCGGAERGGLDVTATTNNPPVLENLEFDPSKFLFQCEAASVCATVSDLDGDSVEFVWSSAQALFQDIEVLSTTRLPGTSQGPGAIEQCVSVVPEATGDYDLRVAVYDQFVVGSEIVRAEEWFLQNGQTNVASHDSLDFPLHVGTDVDLLCINDTGALEHVPGVREFDRVAACDFVTPGEMFCDPNLPGVEIRCPDGRFDPYSVYLACGI